MSEEISETTNILIDGYMALDEEGSAVVISDSYDGIQEGLVVENSDDDDYIYIDEEDMQDLKTEQHYYDDGEITYKNGTKSVHNENLEAEDDRIELPFVVLEANASVKQEIKEVNDDSNEFFSGFEDNDKNFTSCKEEPLEENSEIACDSYFEIIHDDSDPTVEQEYEKEEITNHNDLKQEIIYNVTYFGECDNPEINGEMTEMLIKEEPCIDSGNDSNSGEKYFCEECRMVFNDITTAEEHDCVINSIEQNSIESIQEVKPRIGGCYECTFCQARLKTFGGLQRHQLNCRMKPTCLIPQVQGFECSTCLKLFPNEKSMQAHKRSHDAVESNNRLGQTICDICNTVFTSSKNLKLHRKIHDKKPIKSIQQALPAGAEVEYNELNQFFCEICNKSFDQNLLAVHQAMHQNLEEYNCSVCNRQFESLPSYEMHMQLHTDKIPERRGITKAERMGTKLPFPCNYCGREFARPHEKVKHERIHTGEKPYECEVCGKTFRVSYSLTLHLRTHTDIRPYVCATCNKRFKSQPVYAHHLNTHLAERPYKCNICSKSFRTSVQLCGHKNSHTKPFNCIECNRPFATLYAVKVHMKTHNKANKSNESLKHRCSFCGAVYARIFALRYHMKEQHSIEFDNIQPEESENSADATAATNVISPTELDDEDAALLIAAAVDATNNANMTFQKQSNSRNNRCFNDDSNTSTQDTLQSEEEECSIIVDNFHTEEIVTDWLMK